MTSHWVLAFIAMFSVVVIEQGRESQPPQVWRDRFDVKKSELLPTGTNPYITMQPGRVLKLMSGKDTLLITVLAETQEVDGVVAGVLEERESSNGELVEISRNFLATDRTTGDVYYFGEDVDTTRTERSSITTAPGAPVSRERDSA